MKNILQSVLIILLCLPIFAMSEDSFVMKDIKDFQTLKQYKNAVEFDKYINSYVQNCLDNGYGGTGSLPCLVRYDIWDRELNIAYKELYRKLNIQGKQLLKQSKREWLRTRDLDFKVTDHVVPMDGDGGTAQILIASDYLIDAKASIVKARVILLKNWMRLLGVETKVTEF